MVTRFCFPPFRLAGTIEEEEDGHWQLYFKLYCFLDVENVPREGVEFAFMFEQVSPQWEEISQWVNGLAWPGQNEENCHVARTKQSCSFTLTSLQYNLIPNGYPFQTIVAKETKSLVASQRTTYFILGQAIMGQNPLGQMKWSPKRVGIYALSKEK